MRFSDAVESGLPRMFVTAGGPDFDRNDPWRAAWWGIYGEAPSDADLCVFYHENPTGVQFGTDAEYAVRIMMVHGVTWNQFLVALRGYGL